MGEAHGYDVPCFPQPCPVSGTAPNTPVHGTSRTEPLFFFLLEIFQPYKTKQNMILQKHGSTQHYFLK